MRIGDDLCRPAILQHIGELLCHAFVQVKPLSLIFVPCLAPGLVCVRHSGRDSDGEMMLMEPRTRIPPSASALATALAERSGLGRGCCPARRAEHGLLRPPRAVSARQSSFKGGHHC